MISFLLQKINEIDTQLFHFVNQSMKNPFFDKWMPIITDMENWIWVLALGWLALFIFGGPRGRLVCILIIASVLIADNLNSYILKPLFGRVRPNIALDIAGAVSSKVSPSFPSNHAVNVFAQATVLSWYYRKLSPIWFMGAFVVGFSRVYVGVHYPFDIVGGVFVGMLCSLFVIWAGHNIAKRFKYFSRI